MSIAYVNLCELQSRDELAEAWAICSYIAKIYPDDKHWLAVREAFKVRAQEIGLELKEAA